MDIQITRKQQRFIDATASEVLFGGAAGGGKSWGQVIDAFLCACKYPKSKQLILRRTYPELDKSIIRTALEVYPADRYTYNSSSHTMRVANGSIIDFGYINSDNDVTQYQSAEYDIIRFDELTHFTEYMYTYMFSRLRGANNYPKQVKSATNPGGVGHKWVKARFVDCAPPDTVIDVDGNTRLFIPSLVTDNKFLIDKDPNYLNRLKNLPAEQYRALRYGDWDIFAGQYFDEFRRDQHVVTPFVIPAHWRRYRAIDYGMDRLACMWGAFDEMGNAYIYREYCESNLIVSAAAKKILDSSDGDEECTYSPRDLWNRTKDSGIAIAEIFASNGLPLSQVSNSRVDGWMCLKEWLKAVPDGTGHSIPRLRIFETCTELIACLPMLQHDKHKPNDCATEPHDVTHAPDALRYMMDGRPRPAEMPVVRDVDELDYDDQVQNFMDYGG